MDAKSSDSLSMSCPEVGLQGPVVDGCDISTDGEFEVEVAVSAATEVSTVQQLTHEDVEGDHIEVDPEGVGCNCRTNTAFHEVTCPAYNCIQEDFT